MEFMKITDSSIKISLGAKEAEEYNITEGMVDDTGEIKRTFSKLLERAKRALGIKLPAGKLLAEVFSSRDGGYEIFVSYLKSECEGACLPPTKERSAYLVSSVDSLIYIKEMLDRCAHDYEIYQNDTTGKYYITVKSFQKNDISLAFLYEHATSLRQSSIKYIRSYSTKIAP